MSIFSRTFYKDLLERVISTAAQAALATLVTTAAIQEVDWALVGGITASAALTSALKCVAASFKGDADTASLVD